MPRCSHSAGGTFAASGPRPTAKLPGGAMPADSSLSPRGCGRGRVCGQGRGCGFRQTDRGCDFRKARGGVYQYYIANKDLGITGRLANGFTRLLASIRGRIRKHTGRKLKTKTAIFRMDLLRDKYRMLPAALRSEFEDAAAEDLKQKRQLREEHLARPPAPEAAVADCKVRDAACEAAVAAAGISAAGLQSTSALSKHIRLFSDILGKGSYGTCHVAEDPFTCERFCFKFPKKRAGDHAALFNEHAFMSRLRHPNVLQVHALLLEGETGDPRALVLPLLAGDLWELVVQGPAVAGDRPPQDALNAIQKRSLALQVLAGLGHVHGHGVVHLDLKPDNVLVQPAVAGYTCCLADFGLAQAMTDFKGIAADPTTTADCINTAEHRPFDLFQLAGRSAVAVHPRHDMWAFGCLVFDVIQRSPRLRDCPSGRPLRLMSGVPRHAGPAGDRARWLMRDGRLHRVDDQAARLIRKLQPSAPVVRGGPGQRPQRARCLGATEAADEIRQWGRDGRGCGAGTGDGRGCGDRAMIL